MGTIKDREISIILTDMTGMSKEFTTLRSLLDFSRKEANIWRDHYDKINETASSPAAHIRNHTIEIYHKFDEIIKDIENQASMGNMDDLESVQLNSLITRMVNKLNPALTSYWLWSGNPCSPIFIQCFIEHNIKVAEAFLEYITQKKLPNNFNNNFDVFNGTLLGYEFLNQSSEINKRRNGEKTSLEHLRNSFETARDEIFQKAKKTQGEFSQWEIDNKKTFEKLYRVNGKLTNRKINQQKNTFDTYLTEWEKKLVNLENTYEEKLRLEKPAEYWKKSATKYMRQGIAVSIILIIVMIYALSTSVGFFQSWLSSQELELKLNTVQGVVLFGSIAAIFTFLVRILTRVAFSSFHLMRDAEEREQLTYLYLSLTNEAEIDKDSRDIVLQALFSRSETGLLNQEQGPKMPITEAANILSKSNKS